MSIKQNITSLQNLLEQVNALPDAGGVELPDLINQAEASELFLNKELIDSNGNKVTGTFTIDSELSEQDDLIAQIATALKGKAGGGSGNANEWIPISSLPSVYAAEQTITYYLEVASNTKYLLVKNSSGTPLAAYVASNISGSMESIIGLFDSCKMIKDGDTLYIQIISYPYLTDVFLLPVTT